MACQQRGRAADCREVDAAGPTHARATVIAPSLPIVATMPAANRAGVAASMRMVVGPGADGSARSGRRGASVERLPSPNGSSVALKRSEQAPWPASRAV
jgi:hypothetical protein